MTTASSATAGPQSASCRRLIWPDQSALRCWSNSEPVPKWRNLSFGRDAAQLKSSHRLRKLLAKRALEQWIRLAPFAAGRACAGDIIVEAEFAAISQQFGHGVVSAARVARAPGHRCQNSRSRCRVRRGHRARRASRAFRVARSGFCKRVCTLVVAVSGDHPVASSQCRWSGYGHHPQAVLGKFLTPRSARGTTSPERVSRPPSGKWLGTPEHSAAR